MGELMNCPKCNQLFVKSLYSTCETCRKEEEIEFEKVYRFLRQKENRTATITEASEATGVKETLIIKFVKEGRLRTAMFPSLGYPCERCGSSIQKGKICSDCVQTIGNDLKAHEVEEKREKEKNAYFFTGKNKRN